MSKSIVCPSDGDKTAVGPVTSYVANGGRVGPVVEQRSRTARSSIASTIPMPPSLEGHWIDGREYTLIYSENIDAKYYDEIGWNGFDEQRSLESTTKLSTKTWTIAPGTPCSSGPKATTRSKSKRGSIRRASIWTTSSAKKRLPAALHEPVLRRGARQSAGDLGPAVEHHGGGVNVAFISGRVTFLREDIDYNVYIALMTLNDKKSDSPNPDFQLEDKHYR